MRFLSCIVLIHSAFKLDNDDKKERKTNLTRNHQILLALFLILLWCLSNHLYSLSLFLFKTKILVHLSLDNKVHQE